ncbi:MAG: DUF2703 domain-containing protein [Oscillospiraceae bacterium]|nr:DUF2703 domain-containing protein [Oscillospiraceae bacterium]MCI2034308.1 DUF2703 domain-containing protein [Oscillospiraceae bacterium]
MSRCGCSSENCCGRCQGTEKALDEAVSGAAAVLSAAGYEVRVREKGSNAI